MKLRNLTLAAIAAIATVGAQAEVLVISGHTFADATVVQGTHASGVQFDEGAGQFFGTIDGRSFLTYCTDIFQAFSINDAQVYTRVDGAAQWGAEKAADIGRLFTMLGFVADSADKGALIQAGVWEILNESGRDYSFTSGAMTFSTPSASLVAMAGAFDWNAMKATESRYDVDSLYNADHQDMLVATPVAAVPEPSTYALMVAGLAVVGISARKRRQG